jgi:predicted metalloprotease with PDZ domain
MRIAAMGWGRPRCSRSRGRALGPGWRTPALALCLAVAAVAAAAAGAEGVDRFAWADAAPVGSDQAIILAADLSDLPRNGLLHTRVTIPVALLGGPDGPRALCFPLWTPGTHAPSGPVDNLGELFLHEDHGRPVTWERDPRNLWRILPHLPADATRLLLDLTYIANQPTVNSIGIDVECSPQHAIVNWNCGLFYPQAFPVTEMSCTVLARLPEGWDAATALRETDRSGDVRRYQTMALDQVVDRPLIAGASVQHIVLRPASDGHEVMLHVVAAHPGEVLTDAAMIGSLRRLPYEADALFGGPWFPRYDMLLRLGDGGMGLEHGCCSLCATPLSLLGPDHADDAWARELMPHEFTHSWVGKNRRPIGMLVRDWQEPPVFDGLWVYEGLTELLGRVLAVRCGMLAPEAWRGAVAYDLGELAGEPGRHWRSIRDTCRSDWQLRGHSQHHGDMRRGQDFYTEGALFWLAVDRRIRALSNGRRCLDDFCRSTFGPHGDARPGFSEEQIIAALTVVAPFDWRTMIAHWIDGLGDLDVPAILDGSGWRFERVALDAGNDKQLEHAAGGLIYEAAGLVLREGTVRYVDPIGIAGQAGVAVGDVVLSANGKTLKDDPLAISRAFCDARAPQGAVLAIYRQKRDPQIAPLTLVLPDLLRQSALVRVASEADSLAALLAPQAAPRAAALLPP